MKWISFLVWFAFGASMISPPSWASVYKDIEVLSVYDGDTFTARVEIWPGHSVETRIRLRGVDTPEIRSKCTAEKDMALMARNQLAALLQQNITLRNIETGKYANRVIADVYAGNHNVANTMIEKGLGRPYSGGKRGAWCEN